MIRWNRNPGSSPIGPSPTGSSPVVYSPRTNRRYLELKERIDNNLPKINALGVFLEELLGCSANGCAFKTRNGRVAKLTTDWDEIRFGQWIYLYQRGGNPHPGLPIIDLVRFLESGFFLIVREDIDDLVFDYEADGLDWYNERIAEAVYRIYANFAEEYNNASRSGGERHELFEAYKEVIDAVYTQEIDRANDAEYDGVWADDIDKVVEMHGTVKWLLEHNILICDTIDENWGVRKTDGKIVIRDLGCNNAPILDAALFLPYPPGFKP